MLVRCNHWEDERWLELPWRPMWADQVHEDLHKAPAYNTETPTDVIGLCEAIIDCYARGLCGFDDPTLNLLMALGDRAKYIIDEFKENEALAKVRCYDSHADKAGERIAKLLGLKHIKGLSYNRYATTWGDKSCAGLARSVMRAIAEEE